MDLAIQRCDVCRHDIREISPGFWEHLPAPRSPWGPVCVVDPKPLEFPTGAMRGSTRRQ